MQVRKNILVRREPRFPRSSDPPEIFILAQYKSHSTCANEIYII